MSAHERMKSTGSHFGASPGDYCKRLGGYQTEAEGPWTRKAETTSIRRTSGS
ncbi:hypothetical protein SCOCK_650013 [Actinacidiphila cocklensis]|uniref:Uncharacterized protein n=1 Tax=Actinacidiphila cocklensis TaxID=887465 RepID=A0A9W4DUY6_9ACTN|nr:hypothetical protein SCOCK_650013 [Actinacidiphila cocklensis]